MAGISRSTCKNSVFYRFASDQTVEKFEFEGHEIAVGDLKTAVAEKKGLSKHELVLEHEATRQVYEKDGAMIARNVTVLVKRTPPQANAKKVPVVHLEDMEAVKPFRKRKRDAAAAAAAVAGPLIQHHCPPEFLCGLCSGMFHAPNIARCCGHSACFRCFRTRRSTGQCPLCERPWTEETKPIPNKSLADTVGALDLKAFLLPERKDDVKDEFKEEFKAEYAKKEEVMQELGDAAADFGVATLVGTPAPIMPPLPCNNWGLDAGAMQWPLAAPHAERRHAERPPAPMMPGMLTQEQFLAWQQQARLESDSDSYSSDRSRRKHRHRHKKSKKEKKEKTSVRSDPYAAYAAQHEEPRIKRRKNHH